MDLQSALMIVSACVLVAVGLFGHDQIKQYLDRCKIQRMVRRELARIQRKEMVEWLQERGANE